MTLGRARRFADSRWQLAVLALIAYVPALRSSPGVMPADSKLYLYLDPVRFLSSAGSSFDPDQFAGWVPHQHISYLWPAGPYYALADAVGLPDWVAHRCWIGSLLFAAGAGMWLCARRFGFRGAAPFAAALVYQLSTYILPYISRTSVMLLPWAGLGWILAFTVSATLLATASAPDGKSAIKGVGAPAVRPEGHGESRWSGLLFRWRYPAAIALVVFTVGSVNATALVMITPAPLAWLIYAVATSITTARSALAIALRTAAASIGVSLWWAVMLVIQGRFGARVLPYSETLQDVSFTSTSTEVWRGLGYWLFYIRDVGGPTTSSSLLYLVSGAVILASFSVAIVGLVGLTFTNWEHRGFAFLLIGTGGVLAAGVYPFGDSSPLMDVLTGGGDAGVALALRSSTRALPVMSVGVALGVGAVVSAMPRRWRFARPAASLVVAAILLASMPSIRHAELVDPAISRAERPPLEWIDAAEYLDDTTTERVWQIPGIEFGAFEWGFTVDQPLPGLTHRPVVTRDLLPLGSAPAMDVLYAADDRIQQRTISPDELGSAARVLGVDALWLTGDLSYARFRTARPVDVAPTISEMGESVFYGAPQLNVPEFPWIDERSLLIPDVPLPTATIVTLDQPGQIVRAAAGTVAVSGSGDAFLDSAATRAATEHAAIVYTADIDDETLMASEALVVTDSNRNRNRQWRGSQDAVGATLTADDPVPQRQRDQRLPVFTNQAPDTMTVAVQVGPLTAYADRYGEPFGYQPEHRAAMAIDGDETTAWTVGEHGDPLGAELVVTTTTDVDRLGLLEFAPIDGQRTIDRLAVITQRPDGTSDHETVELREPVAATYTDVEVDAPPGTRITLRIDGVSGGTPLTEGIVADVGFSEVVPYMGGGSLGSTVEWIQVPTDAIERAADADLPVAYSLRRDRVAADDHWRSDPEPQLRRIISVAGDTDFATSFELRIDHNISDERLADLFGDAVWASSRLPGALYHRGTSAVDGDPDTTWMTAFGEGDGAELHLGRSARQVEAVKIIQPDERLSQVRKVILTSGGERREVAIDASGDGEVSPALPAGELVLSIAEIELATTIDRRFGDLRELPISIAEIEFGGGAADVLANPAPPASVTTDCTEIGRIDGEPIAARITLDGGALRGEPLDYVPCSTTDSNESNGGDANPDAVLSLTAGEHRVVGTVGSFQLDGVEFRGAGFDRAIADIPERPVVENIRGDRFARDIELTGCERGCWLVLGEGFNPGWAAELGGGGATGELGPPLLVDGTSNAWWIPPPAGDADAARIEVSVHWSLQRWVRWSLALTLVAVIACALVVWWPRPRRQRELRASLAAFGAHAALQQARVADPRWSLPGRTRLSLRSAVALAAVAVLLCWLLADATSLLVGVPVAALVVLLRRALPLVVAPIVVVVGLTGWVIREETTHRYYPDATWPDQFSDVHWWGATAFALCIAIGVARMVADRRRRRPTL